MRLPKVIYLTGAPASGKSSTLRLLLQRRRDIAGWEYGARLTEHLKARSAHLADQNELRTKSATIVTPDDIRDVDRTLMEFVAENRLSRHVIIDSHPVTKEAWGYRITPFSLEDFSRLAPDEIWMLYASPELTVDRIANDPAGRPAVTLEQARTHTSLQGSVAATYGMSLGKPVYLFDSSRDQSELVDQLASRLT